MIKKIISRNGKEIIPENEEIGYLNKIVKVRYSIFFICKNCNKEVSKQKREEITEDFFLCGDCKKEKNNLEKYGVKHYTNREKFKETTLKEGFSNNSEKALKTKIERYGSISEIIKKANETKLKKYGNKNNYEKIKQTNLEKYGEEFPNLVKDGSNNNPVKARETTLKKYGVENIMQLEEFIEKAKQVKLEKYGDEYYNNPEKAIKTNLERYGTEYGLSNEEVIKKIKQTNLKKYGVENPFKNKEIIKKGKQTKLKKYGNYNNYEKIKQTNLEKYGVESIFQLEEIIEKRIKKNFDNLKIFSNDSLIPLFSYKEYKGIDISNKYKFKCKICNTIFEDHLDNGRVPRCPTCFPIFRSKGEIELASFLKEHVQIIENDRDLIKPKEIDILIPSLNLAIEYNGEYWHTDIERELIKKELVEDKGYDLIVIWEEQWLNNKEEIKKDLLFFIN